MRRRAALLTLLVPAIAGAQVPTRSANRVPSDAISAPITDVRYEVTFTRETALRRLMHVNTTFGVTGRDPVLLSLPAWTPGAYELSNYARWVHNFDAKAAGKSLKWDKLDFDTWRVVPDGEKAVTVSFDYQADSLDNAMAWSREDFLSFNGTNVFLYPEGRSTDFGATVTIKTDTEWQIATGMTSAGTRTYSAKNYHDLVDMPTFVGKFDFDSTRAGDRWVRVASYPSGILSGDMRREFHEQLQKVLPPMIRVTGDTPFDSYTVLIVFDSSYGGGSALEHQNSHFGIYTPFIIGNPLLPSITAHEIFHAWNVKRMRPADMVPYRYDRAQPTPWLWVSEGITDYYSDLAMVRGGVVDSAGFVELVNQKISEVAQAPPTALEDASLSTWIHPTDGSGYLYYPKGSLAGFMLDVMIRDGSDNRHGLDDVMRDVYQSTYKAGRGFTSQDWWAAVQKAAGGMSFAEFSASYIDGRAEFPWGRVLPLAGLRARTDTIREPRLGVFTRADSASDGIAVTDIEEGGAAAEAGVKPGDILVQVGDIPVSDNSFGVRFREQYGKQEGASIPLKVRRDGQLVSLTMKVRMTSRLETKILFDQNASPKAMRIRHGIVTGGTDASH
jgi:predicted metalloprotease with PDZ domain